MDFSIPKKKKKPSAFTAFTLGRSGDLGKCAELCDPFYKPPVMSTKRAELPALVFGLLGLLEQSTGEETQLDKTKGLP